MTKLSWIPADFYKMEGSSRRVAISAGSPHLSPLPKCFIFRTFEIYMTGRRLCLRRVAATAGTLRPQAALKLMAQGLTKTAEVNQ